MKKGVKFLLGVFLIISSLCVTSFSYAESEIPIYEDDIDIQMWPEIPEPYKDVNIKLVSYATDLNKAKIEWVIGGNTTLFGYGKTNYSLQAPGPNNVLNIVIYITPVGSINKITKQIIVRPAEIEVLWEPVDGYTPPFYKGKSLTSSEGNIKVVAIPTSQTIKSGKGNISYKWKRSDDTVEEASGFSKDFYIFPNNVLKTTESISVAASSLDGSYNAVKNLEIPMFLPRVILYKRSPTEGILYNKALNSDTVLSESEMTIVAEPYYLPIKDKWDSFVYTWKINGNLINTPSKKTELTIRPTSKGGYANISVAFENLNKLFQKVTGTLKLTL